MPVTVMYACDGCDAKTEPITVHAQFESFSGKGYGFGVTRYPEAHKAAPDGWVAFDPYTYAAYCPECWAEIVRTDDMEEANNGTKGAKNG